MARIINMSFEVTDAEFANFLERASGNASNGIPGGAPRNVTVTVPAADADEDNAPANPNAPVTDINGTPWNKAFHSSSKAIKDDGTWRRVRGVDNAAADAFEAPYIAAKEAASAPVVTAPVATATAPVVAETPAAASVPLPGSEPAAPVTGLPDLPGLPMPTAEVPAAPVSYEDVIKLYTALMTPDPLTGKGKIAATDIPPLYAKIGLTSPEELKTNETMRADLVKLLKEFDK